MKENSLRLLLISFICASCCSEAFAQYGSDITYPPDFKWDYRFDAQYNSTIKPYLRWYLRQNTGQPRRFPYYHGPGGTYSFIDNGYPDVVVSGCGPLGCVNTGCHPMGHGQVYPARRRSWFNPYQYLRGAGPAAIAPTKRTPERDSWDPLQYLGEGNKKTSPQQPISSKHAAELNSRTAWINRDEATGSVSVLYAEPPAAVRDRFYKATVTVQKNVRITDVRWVESPPWAKSFVLARSQQH